LLCPAQRPVRASGAGWDSSTLAREQFTCALRIHVASVDRALAGFRVSPGT
jgi:hypothetical protein